MIIFFHYHILKRNIRVRNRLRFQSILHPTLKSKL